MRRLMWMTAVIVLSAGAADAQSTTTPPAIGPTSPLGTLGSSTATASNGTGIPLGATEIDPGGLSPAVSPNCSMSGSGASMSGTKSTFDGGGTTTAGSEACSTSQDPPASGIASSLSAPGRTAGSSSAMGGAIPLDSTEIDSGGVSPMITVPLPGATASTSACTGGAPPTGSTGAAMAPSGAITSTLGPTGC